MDIFVFFLKIQGIIYLLIWKEENEYEAVIEETRGFCFLHFMEWRLNDEFTGQKLLGGSWWTF
ncbi:MAG TPA: hypothetical protein VLI68_04565 [Hanamia sp.]|nr:hypothetical protein [Hanamia sp.]